MVVPCPGCKRDMTKHCRDVNTHCHWWACINTQCDVRFADMLSGRTTKKATRAS